MGKAAGLAMNMDPMLGTDFERGLASLKPLAEKATSDRLAFEATAAAAASAPAVTDGATGADPAAEAPTPP